MAATYLDKIYFYPHGAFRDRHLDTIRSWSEGEVINSHILENKKGFQYKSKVSLKSKIISKIRMLLPMINIKRRPCEIEQIVKNPKSKSNNKNSNMPINSSINNFHKLIPMYIWGGVALTGPFITELDNPYALVGYNLKALKILAPIIRRILLSKRCIEIRCISEACRKSLRKTLGGKVADKAIVVYPKIPIRVEKPRELTKELTTESSKNFIDKDEKPNVKFLFIGSQFFIKGGIPLLKAFKRAKEQVPSITLDMITHFPIEYKEYLCEGINVHEVKFTRTDIWDKFMKNMDVLVHPTYFESFGMVVLEAMSHGMAVIANDIYALNEMVVNNKNGYILSPPLSSWDDYLPSELYKNWLNAGKISENVNTKNYEDELVKKIIELASDEQKLNAFKQESLNVIKEKFSVN